MTLSFGLYFFAVYSISIPGLGDERNVRFICKRNFKQLYKHKHIIGT